MGSIVLALTVLTGPSDIIDGDNGQLFLLMMNYHFKNIK